MTVLLDAHAFLWFIMGSPKLSDKARFLNEEQTQQKIVSIATLWEIAIKHSLGRLTLKAPFGQVVSQQLTLNGFEVLEIGVKHLDTLVALPFHHRDPFDRLLIAQAAYEQFPIVSADAAFDSSGISRIW